VNLPVTCAGMLALTAALALGVLSTASLILIVMLCAATASRSVLWTVSYPLAAEAAGRRGIGLGTAVGLLNGIWAATAVLGPLGAGLAAQHLGDRAAFGLTDAACAIALTVTAAAAWRLRLPARRLARVLPARHLPAPALPARRLRPHLPPAGRPPGRRPTDRLADPNPALAIRTPGEGLAPEE
jgi:MFS family permease